MADETSYGWAGKILRVNLSTGSITTQPTDPYKEYIGGMGLANKIMYDEVPAGTDPFSPENKIVFAVGPLTASGVPLAGRTTICSLSTFTKDHLVVDAHCGGMIGAKIKLAGWDAVVLEGASDHPVYLNIVDDKVEIKDAGFVWGMGTREATEMLNRKEGVEACVATIGPAGENLLPYACIINARNHSAGAGTGAVMGSKMLKALVVEGDGSVNVKDPQTVADLSDYMLREVIGSNNNHVVPQTQQEWAEFYDKGSRWSARSGLTWGMAEDGPIDTGEPKPGELNTVGYRCMKSVYDLGEVAEKYTIKMDGCHGCPIHCYSDLRTERTGELGGKTTSGNTCAANFPFKYMEGILKTGIAEDSESGIVWNTLIGTTIDELGLWCNYAQLWRDLAHCIKAGVFDRVLPEEEKAKYDWQRISLSATLFQIRQAYQYARPENGEFTYVQQGQQKNTGIELAANGWATERLQIAASVAAIRSRVSGSGTPEYEGHQTINVPTLRASLYGDYALPWVDGLALLGGVQYSGKKYASQVGTVQADAYAIFNIGSRYSTRIEGYDTVFRLTVDNLFDKRLFREGNAQGVANIAGAGAATYNEPGRTLYTSLTASF